MQHKSHTLKRSWILSHCGRWVCVCVCMSVRSYIAFIAICYLLTLNLCNFLVRHELVAFLCNCDFYFKLKRSVTAAFLPLSVLTAASAKPKATRLNDFDQAKAFVGLCHHTHIHTNIFKYICVWVFVCVWSFSNCRLVWRQVGARAFEVNVKDTHTFGAHSAAVVWRCLCFFSASTQRLHCHDQYSLVFSGCHSPCARSMLADVYSFTLWRAFAQICWDFLAPTAAICRTANALTFLTFLSGLQAN